MLSNRQKEILQTLHRDGGADGWGELWNTYWQGDHGALGFLNCDRVFKALERKGYVAEHDGPDLYGIHITDTGLRAIGITT